MNSRSFLFDDFKLWTNSWENENPFFVKLSKIARICGREFHIWASLQLVLSKSKSILLQLLLAKERCSVWFPPLPPPLARETTESNKCSLSSFTISFCGAPSVSRFLFNFTRNSRTAKNRSMARDWFNCGMFGKRSRHFAPELRGTSTCRSQSLQATSPSFNITWSRASGNVSRWSLTRASWRNVTSRAVAMLSRDVPSIDTHTTAVLAKLSAGEGRAS